MQLPKLKQTRQSRQTLHTFGGYNHNARIAEGEFYDMKNMTSDMYPLLAPRRKRGRLSLPEGAVRCMVRSNGFCYIREKPNGPYTGDLFVLPDGRELDIGLDPTRQPKHMVAMGAYVVILPDQKWVNVAACLESGNKEEKHGSIGVSFQTDAISFNVCTQSGEPIDFTATEEKPEAPADGDYWVDTTVYPPVRRRWYAESGLWVEEPSYLSILLQGDLKAMEKLKKGDVLTGPAAHGGIQASPTDSTLDGRVYIPKNPVITDIVKDAGAPLSRLVIPGIATYSQKSVTSKAYVPIDWSQTMPEMDFVIESGNRLWGCKYGNTEKGFVNEIYASKLGDFKNWESFRGISTDSYVVSVGTDGAFTGAINYLGRPIFFKENCMLQISGSYPASYRLQCTPCDGVRRGCSKSLAVVNNILYYRSRDGICGFDGSLPVQVGRALGNIRYENAVAGGFGGKYYISMENGGEQAFLVYDTEKGMWHKEDDLAAAQLLSMEDGLYCIPAQGEGILIIDGTGHGTEEPVHWMVQTGPMGLTTPETKYISRLQLRLSAEEGSTVTVSVCYDFSPHWEHVYTLKATHLRSFDLPIRPKRCDHITLRLEGTGAVRVYSLSKVWEEGSDMV